MYCLQCAARHGHCMYHGILCCAASAVEYITIQEQQDVHNTYCIYSSVLLHSLSCHPRIPPSVEYRYIGGANAEV